jgi:serine/threonine protein kinase
LKDLFELMTKHHQRDQGRNLFWIPEQFVWYVFECLCIAGLLLERDMKLANVFLGLPNERHYCRYPVPKLGDYGLAIYLPDGKVSDHDLRGTLCNMPIEQNPDLMHIHDLSWPLTSKANVWGIANIVASLMIQAEGFDELTDFRGPGQPCFTEDQADAYSLDLISLITQCMGFNPKYRPDLATVLRDIRTRPQSAQARSLRHAAIDSLDWDAHTIHRDMLDLVRINPTQWKRLLMFHINRVRQIREFIVLMVSLTPTIRPISAARLGQSSPGMDPQPLVRCTAPTDLTDPAKSAVPAVPAILADLTVLVALVAPTKGHQMRHR